MWLNRMLKDRQEILVVGELVLFLAAWVLGVIAAVDDYHVRTDGKAGNNVAATSNFSGSNFSGSNFSGSNFSGSNFSGADFSGPRGEFE